VARTNGVKVLLGLCASLAASNAAQAQKTVVPQAQSSTVPLTDVLAIAKPYPNLRQEIRLARIANTAPPAAAPCTARRLGPEWSLLAGRTIGPYRCRIGDRMLDITTAVTFFDASQHKIASDAPQVMSKAKTLMESRLVWRWL
jgi:hypothetical protein